ncbi:MAG TPA: MFS transporter, partial [Herpetosiphonaceae bacterium]
LSVSAGVYLALPLLPSLGWAALVWSCEALAYSLYLPAVLALLSNAVPAEQRGVSFGLYSVVGSLGAVVAAPLGGWLYERQTALLPFSLTALALAAAAWVLYRFGHALPQSGPAQGAEGAV